MNRHPGSLLRDLLRVLVTLGCALVAGLSHADDLDEAFRSLTGGRAYLRDFPMTKDRHRLVDDFLGLNGATPRAPDLRKALTAAIAIRAAEPPEPGTFPTGHAPRSIQARTLAWESIEALLNGYLYAGNRDLLNATRTAYPGSPQATDPRGLPRDEPGTFPGIAQKPLAYARLYFLQGVKDALDYVASDVTGQLRAGSTAFPALPHYVAFDDETSAVLEFPRFDDPAFGGPAIVDREPMTSAAFAYGNALDRLSLASVAYADQLWRSAYAGPTAGSRRPEPEKTRMLERAVDTLRENVHAAFLGSLPLAAQLADGTGGTANEYQQSRLDQARVNVTAALRLRQQILAGEKPTQAALVSAWDAASIEQQIGRCRETIEAARLKWGGDASPPADGSVAFELTRSEQAQLLTAEREITLRTSLETQLLEITGIDPGTFGGLRTDSLRSAYAAAVQKKFDELINALDPAARGLADGSLMSAQALRMIQAARESIAATTRVASFADRIRIEAERNNDVNLTVTISAATYSAVELAIGMANAYGKFRVCACGTASGTETEFDQGAIPRALQEVIRIFRESAETVTINSINSSAVIKNLLIDQANAADELPVIALHYRIAGAELRTLLARARRIIEDHTFFQGITDTLWYRDPSLTFKLERAEEEYASLLQEARIELYRLARMLEAAWTERFQNPVRQGNGTTIDPLNNGSFDDFTDAESIFSVPNHVRAQAFLAALKAWDLKLRDPQFRGPHSPTLWDANTFSGQPISLRRDIFRLIDYRYDVDGNRYDVDSALSRQSIQRFRAILLNLASRDPANARGLTRLRIDFPLTYNQDRVILGQPKTVPIVQQNRPGGTFDQFWNHRVREIGIRIVGKNVFAAGSTVPVSIELFGNVDRIGFFPSSLSTSSRAISTFAVPLYQRDPDLRLVGEPFLGTAIGIPAAIGSTQVPMNPVNGWPVFCDNIVLRVGSQGSLRIENIDDIELYLRMEVGSPPPVSPGIW